MLRERVRPFVEKHAFPTDLVREFGALGFMGTAYDPIFDGAGLGTSGAAIVAESLARVEPGFAAIFLCNSAPMTVLARYGSDELKREWLETVPGETLRRLASPSRVAAPTLRISACERSRMATISFSQDRKFFRRMLGPRCTVFRRLSPSRIPIGGERPLHFPCAGGNAWFNVGRPGKKIGWRIADSVELFLDHCRVPRRFIIGQRGDGLRQILTTLSIGRILVAATALGLARKAIDLARAYGANRTVGGKPIFPIRG